MAEFEFIFKNLNHKGNKLFPFQIVSRIPIEPNYKCKCFVFLAFYYSSIPLLHRFLISINDHYLSNSPSIRVLVEQVFMN